MKGPVPLALSEAKLGVVAAAGVGSTALFASAHFLLHDVPGIPLRIENGIGRGQDEVHRVVVDLDDLGVGGNAGLQVRALFANAIRREDHIVGGEGIAVLEFHALAQMEPPAGRLRRFPALRQRGDDLQIPVAGHQAFEDMSEMGVGGALVQRVGVERFEVALVGVAQGLGRCRHHRQSAMIEAVAAASKLRRTDICSISPL